MPSCFYIVLGIAALMVIVTLWKRSQIRQIAASRIGEDFGTFRTSFTAEEASEDVLRAVYAKFQEEALGFGVAEFPVRADDDIAGVFGMVDEDLEDAVMEVLAECGRELPPRKHTEPIVTVRDFALFVAACRPVGTSGSVAARPRHAPPA